MKELRACPQCGYGRGFHVCFRESGQGVDIGIICPECGQAYDVSWSTREVKQIEQPEKGEVFAAS